MSSRSSRLTDSHHSTLHAFFLAAKEIGYTEFELQLVTSPKGRVEFCVSPREHSEIGAKFEVRGNMIRSAANDASVVLRTTRILASMEARVQGRHPFGFHRPHRWRAVCTLAFYNRCPGPACAGVFLCEKPGSAVDASRVSLSG